MVFKLMTAGFSKIMTVSVRALSLAACGGEDSPKTSKKSPGVEVTTSYICDQIKIVESSTVYALDKDA